MAVLDKESQVATHQTGHNSGVLHSGIYYKPGSLKARLCVEGLRMMTAFCDDNRIPYERCGKVIVAIDPAELPALEELKRRGDANGVQGLTRLDRDALREIEPHAAGLAALHSPETGIVDFGLVARALAAGLKEQDVDIRTGTEVLAGVARPDSVSIQTNDGELSGAVVVNCAGLQADLVARKLGVEPDIQIVPFRGEYHFLRPERKELVRTLIYPVPDPRFPFLGVHFTRRLSGEIEVGPNAVLAFAREGYKGRTIRPSELAMALRWRGFRALAKKHWRMGLGEYRRSLSKRAFTHALQKLVPDLRTRDLVGRGSGVRAQAVSVDGALLDDFHILSGPRSLHVLNAPSPAATASLAIGDFISRAVAEEGLLS
jgi:L-2-hydroxyglutarate oxidase LhgO